MKDSTYLISQYAFFRLLMESKLQPCPPPVLPEQFKTSFFLSRRPSVGLDRFRLAIRYEWECNSTYAHLDYIASCLQIGKKSLFPPPMNLYWKEVDIEPDVQGKLNDLLDAAKVLGVYEKSSNVEHIYVTFGN